MDFDELIAKGKVSRVFRAKRKLTMPNVVSHITQRAAGKEPLFLEDKDYFYMLATMKDIVKKRSLDVYAFCLMPNHLHLLVSPREDDLEACMRDLFSRYAMMFNRKYERRGHLFGGPYRQSVCLDDTYLLAVSLYIHMNPVRAGIENDSRRYRWSSVKLFCDSRARSSFVKATFVLRLLGNGEKEQKEVYSDLLARSASLKTADVLESKEAVRHFREALHETLSSVCAGIRKRGKTADRTGLEWLEEEQILERVQSMKERGRSLSPETVKARRFLAGQLIARGYQRRPIAAMFGVSLKTLYNTLKSGGGKHGR